MNKNFERVGKIVAVGLAAGIGMTACGGSKSPKLKATIHTNCTGLEFASPKGGPGEIKMNVYPTFNRNFGDARPLTVTGEVVGGNDKGNAVSTNGSGSGEFTFSWDTESTAVQSSAVDVNVQFEGFQLTCPETTVYFNPTNYAVTHHLANSPY